MTLLIAVTAAVICTIIWYSNEKARRYGVGTLTLFYWGASLMWLVDAVVEYAETRAEYFQPAAADMLNDAFLGVSVVVFGMVIWGVMLLFRDPDKVVKKVLLKK